MSIVMHEFRSGQYGDWLLSAGDLSETHPQHRLQMKSYQIVMDHAQRIHT